MAQPSACSTPNVSVPCHSDSPTLAQLQANREGTLFGPGLILFREDLYILSGNCPLLESRSYGFATKTRGGRGNMMKACGRASLRFQKSGYLSIETIFASAHFVRVNNGGGLARTKPIVGSARHAERSYCNEQQRTRDSFCRIEKHAGDLHSTTSIPLSDAARLPLIQIIESLMPRSPEIRGQR